MKLVMLVAIYCIGAVNGWIGGYQYAERTLTIEVKKEPK
jgi:uncharacterized protein YneF (UPF0154 family)